MQYKYTGYEPATYLETYVGANAAASTPAAPTGGGLCDPRYDWITGGATAVTDNYNKCQAFTSITCNGVLRRIRTEVEPKGTDLGSGNVNSGDNGGHGYGHRDD